MGADATHRGQLSAWLRKKKSGTSSFRIREYNKRYFTLDFDTHTFFYAHSEGSKKVSAVTPFADIVDVRLPEADKVLDKGDNISEVSKTSRVSFFRRPSSFLTASKEEEQHMLMVMTRPSKTFELLCSSATEAVTWFEALKTAIAMDRNDVEAHTTAPSEEEKPRGGGYPSPGAGAGATVDASISPTSKGDGETSPPPVRGTFLDLTLEEAPADKTETSTGAAPEGSEGPGATLIEAAGPVALQASDFGFAEDEDGSISSASSDEAAKGSAGYGGKSAPAAPPAVTYSDRHEGMSMKERLQSLEFSDAEDDDDDPLGLKGKK